MIDLSKKNVPNAKYIHIFMTDINFNEEFDGIFAGYSMICLDPDNFKKTADKIIKTLKSRDYFFIFK